MTDEQKEALKSFLVVGSIFFFLILCFYLGITQGKKEEREAPRSTFIIHYQNGDKDTLIINEYWKPFQIYKGRVRVSEKDFIEGVRRVEKLNKNR